MISVLYVDDEQTLLDIGKLFLERSGDCSVDTAISARQALELMGTKAYDAIVADYQMPEMDGIAFLKHIRTTSDIPFILFTGKGREEVVIEAINNGADFYLQKGGDPRSQFVELEHKIRQAVKRQHAEHDLRTSEIRYRELVELLPQTVFEIDQRGMIISVNPVGLKTFGYTVKDLENGVNISQVFVPRDLQRMGENIRKVLSGEPTGGFEYTALRKDGSTFPVLIYSAPVYRDRTPVGLRGVLIDITERKQAEEVLRDSAALLNTILQSSPIPKFVIDTSHRIISWNKALEEASGIRAEEVLGTTRQWMAFYPHERPCMADLIVDGSIDRIPELYTGKSRKSLLIEGAYEATDFFPHLGRKGMWLHFIAAPIMDSAGTVIGAVETLENITELKEAEEALRTSEKRYRTVVEDQTELICRFRPDGILTFVNDAYCQYFGLKKDACIGKLHGVMLPPDDASRTKEHLKALTPENPVAGIEHRIIMPSGELRWQRWNDRAIFDESGNLVEYQSVGRDTTDRKRAEEALELANERLRYLLSSIPVAIYTSKTSGDYGATSITENVLQITGYESRDFTGNSGFWIEHVHPEDKKKIFDELPKLFEKNVHSYEYRFSCKDGRYIWISDNMRLIKDEDGNPREILGQWMDITERKQAEEALRESEEKYRTLAETTRDIIVTTDFDGIITYANSAARRLTGDREIVGVAIKEFFAEDQVNRHSEMLKARRQGLTETLAYEWQITSPTDGSSLLLDVRSSLLMDRGKPSGVLFNARDITGRKEADAVLGHTRDESGTSQQAQNERAERALRYQKALVRLATTDAPTLRDAMNRITETGAAILGVERTGIWFFSSDGTTLLCSDLYTRTKNLHESGQTINGTDYPRYFAALQDNRTIVASDARTHEHTREFAFGYLEKAGISSMLNVPIRSGRTVVGVLCFEHTGPARPWDVEDSDFAASVADFAAIVLEKARRRLAEKDLQKSEDRARVIQFAVEHASEGILWLNTEGNVVYANPAYCRMLGYTISELLKLTIFDIEPTMSRDNWGGDHARKVKSGSFTFEVSHARKGGERFPVEVTSDSFTFGGETYICSYVRDISERTREQKALHLANQKLNLLSSVTRHDILNKLTIVLGYLELSKMAHDQEKLEDFIKKIDETITVIQHQIQFTRDYQDMGVKAPEWQDAAGVFANVLSQLEPGTVRVHNDLFGLSLYADPLLERAVYNIVDNALRYGEKLTTIRARYLVKDNGGLIWIIEDDGVGISAKDKSMIFNKGFGHHTGLGLFLTREILSITGMMIMETGFPGTGARFEIHVPSGAYRLA